LPACAVLLDLGRHSLGPQHAVPECPQHALLEWRVPNRPVVGARAGLAVRGAPPTAASDHGKLPPQLPHRTRPLSSRLPRVCNSGRIPTAAVKRAAVADHVFASTMASSGTGVVTHCSRGFGRATRLRVTGSRSKRCRL
jgi:hypothetical protein